MNVFTHSSGYDDAVHEVVSVLLKIVLHWERSLIFVPKNDCVISKHVLCFSLKVIYSFAH